VEGTLEVIEQNIDQESVKIVAKGVGQVTESDVELARASRAHIIAFRVKFPSKNPNKWPKMPGEIEKL